MQVRAQLIHDFAIAQAGAAYIPVLMAGECLGIAAIRIGTPHIECAVTVADEIQAALPPHRAAVITVFIAGQTDGFLFALQIKTPQLGDCTATVMLGIVIGHLQTKAGEIQITAAVIQHRLIGIGNRENPAFLCFWIDRRNHAVCVRAGTVERTDQDFTLRGPAQYMHHIVIKADALRQPTLQGHNIRLSRTFIGSGKCQPLAIFGYSGLDFRCRMGSQTLRLTAL